MKYLNYPQQIFFGAHTVTESKNATITSKRLEDAKIRYREQTKAKSRAAKKAQKKFWEFLNKLLADPSVSIDEVVRSADQRFNVYLSNYEK